jgi:hypothetical protein
MECQLGRKGGERKKGNRTLQKYAMLLLVLVSASGSSPSPSAGSTARCTVDLSRSFDHRARTSPRLITKESGLGVTGTQEEPSGPSISRPPVESCQGDGAAISLRQISIGRKGGKERKGKRRTSQCEHPTESCCPFLSSEGSEGAANSGSFRRFEG